MNEIKLGIIGQIIRAKNPLELNWYIKVIDDKENTGGYLIFISSGKNFSNGDTVYDEWVEKEEHLNKTIAYKGWEITWLYDIHHESYQNFIEEKGIYLKEKVGVNEYALKRENALEAIKIRNQINARILGGDVLIQENGKFKYTYDNWSIKKEEDNATSFNKSEEYIKNYPEKESGTYYYVIV